MVYGFFVPPPRKPLCHRVDDGENEVDDHGQKDVSEYPGQLAGFLDQQRRGGVIKWVSV